MTTFLNWVFAQANKVYDWFGSAYYTLKNAAANAWNWAVDRAREAYQNAINWSYNQLLSVKTTLTGSIAWLQQTVYTIRDGLMDDLSSFIDWVTWKFNTLGDYASSLVNQALSGITSTINWLTNNVQVLIDNAVNWVWSRVMEALDWVISLRDRLLNLVTVFTTDRLSALLAFLSTGLNTITTFFANPVVFILDVIQEHVLGFLAYVIAWSLGSTKTDLPNDRPWRK